MKIKVSDYVAKFFAEKGIKTVFTVVGGGSIHLNDSFGHNPDVRCVYNHHEQASAMAAEGYFRVNNELAGVCVTSGPGAINALNGVAGAYQDSIPMLVISGQCKRSLMARNCGLNLRTLGPQEFDIVPALGNFTKYAETIMDPMDIRYCLEKAYYIAVTGRPGPSWLEIPIDVQGARVETDELRGFCCDEWQENWDDNEVDAQIDILVDKLKIAKRPVVYAGNGIRISGAIDQLYQLVDKIGIPVVTCWDSVDAIDSDNRCFAGRAGTMGDRTGNFAVQNSDLLLTIGTRLNTYQVGYNVNSWAREAYVIDVDIDPEELKKPTIRVDLPICCDAKVFLEKLINKVEKSECYNEWIDICNNWKQKYPVVTDKMRNDQEMVNVYDFVDRFSKSLPDGSVTVVGNGSASVVGSAAYYIKKGQRFIMNCGISSMGYDLPAAVGAGFANSGKEVICLTGDGSIQMNIQELQTIVTNKLPVKIVVINNEGYHQIRLTQNNLFNANHIGIGPESKDLGFPDFGKLAWAYGIPYEKCASREDIQEKLNWVNEQGSFCMLEVICNTTQIFEPKSATKKLDDGSLYSPPLEDSAPFLEREELKENMLIKLWDER